MEWFNSFNILVVLISGALIIFARNPFWIALGVVFLFFLAYLAQNESSKRHHYEFVIERFKAGDVLECGFLRTSQTLVDPANGWKLYREDGFIKDDQIINEARWCSVVGKPSPEPLYLWGWITYAGIGLVFGILRFVFRNARKEFYRVMDKADKEDQPTASHSQE